MNYLYHLEIIAFHFLSFAVRELDVPGEIYERKTYPFEFSTVEMPYETYNGVNVRLRYGFLKIRGQLLKFVRLVFINCLSGILALQIIGWGV